MCQLNWAVKCPDICLNIILGETVKVFVDEIAIQIDRLNKANYFAQFNGPHPVH
jgi:hypothetical protein